MNRARTKRRPVASLLVAAMTLAATIVSALPASGHPSVPAAATFGFAPNPAGGSGALGSTPPYAPNAFTTISLRAPFEQTVLFNGSADTTVDVKAIVPAGWTNPSCGPAKVQINNSSTNNTNQAGADVPGWSCEIVDVAGRKVIHWSGPQTVANLAATANLTAVKIGTAGQVALYNFAGSTNMILDVVGYFALT